jgi:hypothetical protein
LVSVRREGPSERVFDKPSRNNFLTAPKSAATLLASLLNRDSEVATSELIAHLSRRRLVLHGFALVGTGRSCWGR